MRRPPEPEVRSAYVAGSVKVSSIFVAFYPAGRPEAFLLLAALTVSNSIISPLRN